MCQLLSRLCASIVHNHHENYDYLLDSYHPCLTDMHSVASMDQCVRRFSEIGLFFINYTISKIYVYAAGECAALLAATLHPAQAIGIDKRKGTLSVGSDADFILLDEHLHVKATYIAGERVWSA